MADTEVAAAAATVETPAPPPAAPPKEKKKRSVKSSEKSSKAAAAAAAAAGETPTPPAQQNGVATEPVVQQIQTATTGIIPAVAPDSLARELAPTFSDDASLSSVLKPPVRYIVAGETEPEPQWENEEEAFYLLDFNQDGLICKKDLQMTYASLGRADAPDHELQAMLDEAKSPLDFEAFVKLLGFKTVDLDSEEMLVKALAMWDIGKTGLIPEPTIRHDLMTWGDKFSEQEAKSPLDFEAFVKLLGFKTVDLDSEEMLVKALAMWDIGKTGLIPEPTIRHDLMTWGDKFSEQE
ncbi:hypothetical protein B566_EDAN017145 [Ephemera danica]|nr:hypothetical protein B566_EDAN017145 [Ephemera danica]